MPPFLIELTPSPLSLQKCVLCQQLTHNLGDNAGTCVQCTAGRCTTALHVSCAQAADVLFEASEWPRSIYITCNKHTTIKGKRAERQLTPLRPGERVLAKHKNGRYYKGKVETVRPVTFIEVDFEDGTFTTDTYPQDIEVRGKYLLCFITLFPLSVMFSYYFIYSPSSALTIFVLV